MIRDRIKELRRVKASELRPNPRNWRTHPKAQQDALRGVLAEVGYADALIARECDDGTLMLLDGHLRAETTPGEMVPVLVLDVTEAEGEKILLTLDPLAAMAEANKDVLQSLLADLETDNEAMQAMLDELAKENGIVEEPAEIVEDVAPVDAADELREKWGVEPGQVWVIEGKGVHRLMCGDSTKGEDVGRLMGGKVADICFTSPPYGQQRDYTKKIDDWDALMQGVFANLPMAPAGQVLVNLGLIHRDGEWVPYWDEWIEWMRVQGWRRFGWYVWDQGPGLPGDWSGRLAPSFEFVWHFNKESVKPAKARDCKHAGEGHGGKGQRGADGKVKDRSAGKSAVQDHAIHDSVLRVNRQGAMHGASGHPAPYPVGLPAFAFQSWPGAAYEPFSGSGTTLVAAEQLSRNCYAMEIEPKYVAIALERMAKLGALPRLTSD